MGQSIHLAAISMEIASKLKIQNSWVNRFIWPENASEVKIEGSIVYRAEISMENTSEVKIDGSIVYLAEISMKNASKLNIQNYWVHRFISPRLAWKMH